MMEKKNVYEIVQSLQPLVEEIARTLWSDPETGGNEVHASALLRKVMASEGFKIINNPELPYAFCAEYGSGKPVIAVIGEYDALPGLSQQVCAVKTPVTAGAPGHGCGHNLFGAGSSAGAITLKRLLEETGMPGTVRFYACPEEELLSGKVKMAYYHMFDGCDIAINWHPWSSKMVYDGGMLALGSAKFYFHGITAHAGAAPEDGRSTLDAVELMSVGANYLREHTPDQTRIHYSTNGGGFPPNVVPDYSDAWYYVRAPHIADVKDILRRLDLIAKGAAMMTETTEETEIEYACCEIRMNHTYGDLTQRNLVEAGDVEYTEEELAFAKSLQDTLAPAILAKQKQILQCESPMSSGQQPRDLWKEAPLTGSSDCGDVSQIMPMNMFVVPCWPVGCTPHTWQATASTGSTLGEKGALYAAKVIAGIGYDLLTQPETVEAIKAEFETAGGSKDYKPMYKEMATI